MVKCIPTMLINFSNHPSDRWSKKQVDAAAQYGADIFDIRFPRVDAECDESAIESMADEYAMRILSHISDEERDAVMVQGEFTLSFAVIKRLLREDVTVLSACSERKVNESVDDAGKTNKEVIFDFVRFREYR